MRLTAAAVACDGVAETVFPGGKTMDTLNLKLSVASSMMVVITLSGAVACLMAVDRSCETVAWLDVVSEVKESVKATVAW